VSTTSLDWLRLDSHYVIRDPWFTLRADSYRLPDDRVIGPVYIMEYGPWVNVIAVTPSQEAVLVRQYRPGLGRAILEPPGGAADGHDVSMLEAARRELLEETGYTSDDFIETGVIAPNPASHNNLMHCFLARNVQRVRQPALDETEHLEVVLVPFDELIVMAGRGELPQALHVASLYFALAHLGRVG
jgi:ADP-ribose pyrophosphatase